MGTTPENPNLAWWDEVTPHHVNSRYYDVAGFLQGKSSLLPLELEALGAVKGKRLLHLQCHIGLDTLSWARLGAQVTGVDFSSVAIEAAKDLARRAGLEAQSKFIQIDVLDWHSQAKPEFDLVVTTYGVLCWLKDLNAWAKGVAASLRPGGIFFLADGHPLSETNEFGDYFGRENGYGAGEPGPDYASDHVVQQGNQQWVWPVSSTIQALLEAGLRLEVFKEYPYSFYEHVKGLQQGSDGYWHLPAGSKQVPFMFSLKMSKPLD